MSFGELCPCADLSHARRSQILPLAGEHVCSSYSADQEAGGKCPGCRDRHGDAPERREELPESLRRLGELIDQQPYRPTGPHHPDDVARWYPESVEKVSTWRYATQQERDDGWLNGAGGLPEDDE